MFADEQSGDKPCGVGRHIIKIECSVLRQYLYAFGKRTETKTEKEDAPMRERLAGYIVPDSKRPRQEHSEVNNFVETAYTYAWDVPARNQDGDHY